MALPKDSRRNRYDKKDSLEIGDRAENIFKRMAVSRGWELEDAPEESNINEHWDFLMKKENESYKVDIKGMKRVRRSDQSVQDEWVWIELHGVRPYDRGWLYDGKADLISFEKMTSFVIVKRIDLIALVEKQVDLKTLVHSPGEAKYRIYNRSGRPDRITLIEMDKLNLIKWGEWAKLLSSSELSNGS